MDEAGGPVNTYVGELYFNAHRGTYTSQAKVKQNNRRAEFALREMEMWGAFGLCKGNVYDSEKADALWKELLLNQFTIFFQAPRWEEFTRKQGSCWRCN